MKQRLDYIDEMKGFAILLVTMGHIYLPYTAEGQSHPVAQMIYSCHMAFFFFLSGFMLYRTHGLDTKGVFTFVSKKLQTIILPWLSFTILVQFVLHRGFDFTFSVADLNPYPVNGYWFLPVLFCFMMLWLCCHKISNNALGGAKYGELFCNGAAILAILGLGTILHLYYLLVWAIYYTSFIFGYELSGRESLEKYVMRRFVFGLSSIVLILAWKFGPIDTMGGVAWRSMVNLCWSAMCSLTASIVFFNLFRSLQLPNIVKKYLQETGKLSLCIYLIPVVLLPAGFIFPKWMPNALLNISIFAIALITNAIRYTIGMIILRTPYLSYILLGKK